jgi:hypothetical protein
MNKTYADAADAMRAAYELSQKLGRPVWRHITLNKHGAPCWYISLNKTPHNAL